LGSFAAAQDLGVAGRAHGLDHLEDALAPGLREARSRWLGRDQSDSNDHENDGQEISQTLLGDAGRQVAAKYDSWN
jgi:hypothetical protein